MDTWILPFCMKYRWFRLDFPGDLYIVVVDDNGNGNVCCMLGQQPIIRLCDPNVCQCAMARTKRQMPQQQQNEKSKTSLDKFHSSTTITAGEIESEREMGRNFHKWKFLQLPPKYVSLCADTAFTLLSSSDLPTYDADTRQMLGQPMNYYYYYYY